MVMQEIPSQKRLLGRPELESLFNKHSVTTQHASNERIIESIEKYGYHQKEVADHIGLHYSTISRLINKANTE
ncbi:MAG: helix-turn-helix domain-containing protein [Candidatus Brocadiaceae bacterium]|nr:helix-turn-helix domain-containing protein [Candidatus Brocadiaceae bacterium]